MQSHPSHKSRKSGVKLPTDSVQAPPPERLSQDAVVLVEENDPDGETVRHYRIADTISRLASGGLVEPRWVTASDRFRRDFALAAFNPLSANDLRRPRGAGGREQIVDRVEDARQRLWRAVQHLGGMSSPAGSISWHVIGAEMSVQQWSLRQGWGSGKPLRHDIATGILISALGALSGHYGTEPRMRLSLAHSRIPSPMTMGERGPKQRVG